MHGPEELPASYVMLLAAYPVLLVEEKMQYKISSILAPLLPQPR